MRTEENPYRAGLRVEIRHEGHRYSFLAYWDVGWVLRDGKLAHGLLTRPVFRIWPGDEPVHVDITRETVARWKKQFEEGFGVNVPAELRPEIDRALGMGTLS